MIEAEKGAINRVVQIMFYASASMPSQGAKGALMAPQSQ